jgi:hypothetical protein
MKYVASLLSIIFTSTAFAVGPARSFICSAEDSLGRQSVLTFDVDDKTIFIKSADDPSFEILRSRSDELLQAL